MIAINISDKQSAVLIKSNCNGKKSNSNDNNQRIRVSKIALYRNVAGYSATVEQQKL